MTATKQKATQGNTANQNNAHNLNTTKKTTKISNSTIIMKDLSDEAFRLYCVITMLAGKEKQVSIYISNLADILGKSPRSIRRNLNELTEHGLITRIFRKPKLNMPIVFLTNTKEAR